MTNWRILSVIAMLCQGISPVLHNKAIQTHGAMMNIVLAQVVFVPISIIWLLGHKSEIQSVSRTSFAVSFLASILSITYAICMFYAFEANPKGNSVIMITISFSIVILALINHFLGHKMEFHQWMGAMITFLGIALVNWKR